MTKRADPDPLVSQRYPYGSEDPHPIKMSRIRNTGLKKQIDMIKNCTSTSALKVIRDQVHSHTKGRLPFI
jgi:hypothetical protein